MDLPDIRQTCWWQHTWAEGRSEHSEPGSTALGFVSAGWEASFKRPQCPELPGVLGRGITTLWGTKSKWERDASSSP